MFVSGGEMFRKILDVIFDVFDFIPNLLVVFTRTLWCWVAMSYLLAFKGRKHMNEYHHKFMNAPSLTYEQRIKWIFISASLFWTIIYIIWV